MWHQIILLFLCVKLLPQRLYVVTTSMTQQLMTTKITSLSIIIVIIGKMLTLTTLVKMTIKMNNSEEMEMTTVGWITVSSVIITKTTTATMETVTVFRSRFGQSICAYQPLCLGMPDMKSDEYRCLSSFLTVMPNYCKVRVAFHFVIDIFSLPVVRLVQLPVAHTSMFMLLMLLIVIKLILQLTLLSRQVQQIKI